MFLLNVMPIAGQTILREFSSGVANDVYRLSSVTFTGKDSRENGRSASCLEALC